MVAFKGSFVIKPGLTMRSCRSLISATCVSRVSPIACPLFFFCRRFVLPLRVVVRRATLAMRPLFASFALIGMGLAAPAIVAQKVELSVEVSKAGAKIDRNIFGQFAEHLGHGIYEGIWVGPDSTIPNTRGIRNDVVAALKAIHVPNVRWPGGCFADEYHWRNGIGSPRGGNAQSQLGRRDRAELCWNA